MTSALSRRNSTSVGRFGVVAIAAGLLFGSGLALAQPKAGLPEITVQAQRSVTIARGKHVGTSSRQMGALVTMSARLDVADLDLSTSGGTDELRARINDVARDICHRLEQFYKTGASDVPGYEDTNKNCVRDAVAAASKSADAAIAAAQRG